MFSFLLCFLRKSNSCSIVLNPGSNLCLVPCFGMTFGHLFRWKAFGLFVPINLFLVVC